MKKILFGLLACLLLAGCAAAAPQRLCKVVLEENPLATSETAALTLTTGEAAVFTLELAQGCVITGTDCPGATVAQEGTRATVTLPDVRYSTVIALQTKQNTHNMIYDTGESVWVGDEHLAANTLPYSERFAREGYTLTGWRTADGRETNLGGRIMCGTGSLQLYANWQKWSSAADFVWSAAGDTAIVTGYTGSDAVICLPATLDGHTVTAVAQNAFAGVACDEVILPPSLRRVEPDAFAGATLQTLTMFDTITEISDRAFAGCASLQTLHLNAARAPVYSGSYYAAFADKYDRLCALQGQKKLILFSGSSTRFGYDCAALATAFPQLAPVNMGVFAYTNAAPQLLLILAAAEPGDILLHAPEFDAAQRQFCTATALDEAFFAMMEANYTMLSALDLRQVSGVFTAFAAYQDSRSGMTGKDYTLSPADFDEDGNPAATPTYNKYGDYIAPRPNAVDDAPVYGLQVDYTVQSYPTAQFIAPLNAVYAKFEQAGVTVYFTYAPRNAAALSAQSTAAARAELDEYLKENIIVPVISDIEQSLYPGRYLYGTDNHLSTEGVQIRTERVCADLQQQFLEEGAA